MSPYSYKHFFQVKTFMYEKDLNEFLKDKEQEEIDNIMLTTSVVEGLHYTTYMVCYKDWEKEYYEEEDFE